MPDDTIKIAIEAVDNASATFEKVGDEVDKLGKRGTEAGEGAAKGAQGFESFAGKLVAIQAGVSIAQEAIGGLKQVWDFAKQGAENQRIAASFSKTAESIGADADDIIAKLDEAARGTVDDEELMQASTRALTLGVAKSGDDLVKVMKLARGAALQFGGDAGQAFETINQAIGNLAPRALKQYGIIVSLKDANEAYAKTLGVTADSLTDEQQRQALLNAVLEQGAKNFKDIGDSATTTGEKMKALETRFGNLVDVIKETAATGLSTAFDIGDAPGNAVAAFTGTAEKMRQEVLAGRMSVKDYNDALKGMAQTIAPLVGQEAALLYKQNQLTDSFYGSAAGAYGFNSALDETNRAQRRAADEAENLRRQEAQLASIQQDAIAGAGAFSDAYDESARALRRTQEAATSVTGIMDELKVGMAGAIKNELTQFGDKQKDLKTKAQELRNEIDKLQASQGRAVTTTSKATLTDNERIATQAKLAAITEDLTSQQRKANETDAEFASRMANLQVQADGLSEKLGNATTATTSYIDNSKRIKELEGQFDGVNAEIEANAAAHEEATKRILFGYAEQQLAVGGLTETEAKALDAMAVQWGLKSQADVDAMQAIRDASAALAADGNIEAYNKKLQDIGSGIIDAIPNALKASDQAQAALHAQPFAPIEVPIEVKVEEGAAGKASEALQAQARGMKPVEVEVKVKPVVIEEALKGAVGDSMAERRTRVTVDTAQASKDIQSYTTDKVGAIPKEKKTTAIFDTYKATNDTRSLLNLYGSIPSVKNTTVDVDGTLALQTLDDIIRDIGKVISKTVTITVKYLQEGDKPFGAQHGADFIVPPARSGAVGDYFPILAAAGERVIVQTPTQQKYNTTSPAARNGDTYNYTTNVYNPLAAAMLADQQRRERLARSNARMGVS